MSIDNCTIARVLPFIGKKRFYYATFYGQILYYESGKWRVTGYKKDKNAPEKAEIGLPTD